MAFLGVTRHGTYSNFLDKQPAFNPTPFADISDEEFDRAFDIHVMGAHSPNAQALQIDGANCILRKELPSVLKSILGREPRQEEFDVFFTWLCFDNNCFLPREEYRKAYQKLKCCCAKEGEQRHWHSYDLKRKDWIRHKRLPYSPQDTLTSDMTESQKIGWHTAKPLPALECFKPAGSTDVTQREGRSLMDYYGLYTLIGLQR